MQTPIINAGTQWFISETLPNVIDAAHFAALPFVKIKAVRSTDRLGGQYKLIENNAIGELQYNERSGLAAISFNLELITMQDAGQTLLKAAYYSSNSYAYKVQCPDGAIFYFTAECSSRFNGRNDPKTLADIKTTLEINSQLIEV